jgi:hypothetical protein
MCWGSLIRREINKVDGKEVGCIVAAREDLLAGGWK